MQVLRGKYNKAIVFTDFLDPEAQSQIIELCNQEQYKGCSIRMMPDAHSGKGCVIGTTMTLKDKISPSMVGVDISCGVEVNVLEEEQVDLSFVDRIIKEEIPSGMNTRDKEHPFVKLIERDLASLKCKNQVNLQRARLSLGTCGGGNHFIEISRGMDGFLYLLVHSGSRHLGKQVAEYYQDLAYRKLKDNNELKQRIITELKAQGREREIEQTLKSLPCTKGKKELAYVEGRDFEDYLHDMAIVARYADLNRKAMLSVIVKRAGLHVRESWSTVHNYIDIKHMILRKGAISARAGEKVIIPINMRDGSLIAIGKGNPFWNYSAPHGAGRVMSRAECKRKLSLEEFQKAMAGVYTTTVGLTTLDEAPMAYKPMDEIIGNTTETVTIIDIATPIYNFKDSSS